MREHEQSSHERVQPTDLLSNDEHGHRTLEGLVQRLRRRPVAVVGSGVAAALALVLAVTVVSNDPDPDPNLARPAPPVSSPQPPTSEHVQRPDFGTYPQHDHVASFTAVATGIVYVQTSSSRVVWESWQHERRLLGHAGLAPGRPPVTNPRDLAGNPLHDLVAWVETTGRWKGHLVVVRASTGKHLAATDVRDLRPWTDSRSPEAPEVVIASIDAETVWFAPKNAESFRGIPGNEVRTWHWAAGEPPRVEPARADQQVVDVSGGVWAIEGGLIFQNAEGRVLSQIASPDSTDRSLFGGPLSPDGRYWYGAGNVIETATGTISPLAGLPRQVNEYGWTGASTFTFITTGERWVSCDVELGACAPPQRCGFLYCIAHVPVS